MLMPLCMWIAFISWQVPAHVQINIWVSWPALSRLVLPCNQRNWAGGTTAKKQNIFTHYHHLSLLMYAKESQMMLKIKIAYSYLFMTSMQRKMKVRIKPTLYTTLIILIVTYERSEKKLLKFFSSFGKEPKFTNERASSDSPTAHHALQKNAQKYIIYYAYCYQLHFFFLALVLLHF